MRLEHDDAMTRLCRHDHGVLCTLHAERGPDAVPVVYAVASGAVGVPIDLVKPKAATTLQRERNLAADQRATLLVDHWDRDDWTQLWWVRAQLHWRPGDPRADELAVSLTKTFPQYADQPFARVLVFDIVTVSGWSAIAPHRTDII